MSAPRRTPRAFPLVLVGALSLLAVGTAAAQTFEILWIDFPSVMNTTLELQVGDTIEWDIGVGHDLTEMPTQALFDACDFTGSTLIANGPSVTQTSFNTPGVHYFSCGVGLGFHCDFLAMRVRVVVSEGGPQVPSTWPLGVAAALALTGLAALRSRRQASWPPRRTGRREIC